MCVPRHTRYTSPSEHQEYFKLVTPKTKVKHPAQAPCCILAKPADLEDQWLHGHPVSQMYSCSCCRGTTGMHDDCVKKMQAEQPTPERVLLCAPGCPSLRAACMDVVGTNFRELHGSVE